jgi:hypothetical protein
MRTSLRLFGITFIGWLVCGLLTGCTCSRKGNSESTFLPGPVISGGLAYYPVKPGATYHNAPVDYTTNQPPAGVVTFVRVHSTNGLVIDLTDGNPVPDTNGTAIRFITTKSGGRDDVSAATSSPASGLY